MENKYNIGDYYLASSFIHKLNPILKSLSLIIILISLLFVNSYIDVLLMFLYLILCIMYSNIDIDIYYKNILRIKILLLIILILDVIFKINIHIIIFNLFSIIYIVLYILLFTLTTPQTEIIYSIKKYLIGINKILPVDKIALEIILIFRFIPILIEHYDKINRIKIIRKLRDNSLKFKITMFLQIHKLAFVNTLDSLRKLKENMYIRLYGYSKSRTNYRLNKWDFKNTFVLILNIIILILVIIY